MLFRTSLIIFQRKEILNGNVEPTDSDCDWPSDEEEEELVVCSTVG